MPSNEAMEMNIEIRKERATDFSAVAELNKIALHRTMKPGW